MLELLKQQLLSTSNVYFRSITKINKAFIENIGQKKAQEFIPQKLIKAENLMINNNR